MALCTAAASVTSFVLGNITGAVISLWSYYCPNIWCSNEVRGDNLSNPVYDEIKVDQKYTSSNIKLQGNSA